MLLAVGIGACNRSPAGDSSHRDLKQQADLSPIQTATAILAGEEHRWVINPPTSASLPGAVYGPQGGEVDVAISCDAAARRLSVSSYDVGGARPVIRRQAISVGDVRADLSVDVLQENYGDDVMWVSTSLIPLGHPLAKALATSKEPISFLQARWREPAVLPSADAVRRVVGSCFMASR